MSADRSSQFSFTPVSAPHLLLPALASVTAFLACWRSLSRHMNRTGGLCRIGIAMCRCAGAEAATRVLSVINGASAPSYSRATSRWKPERHVELRYTVTAIVSHGREQVNGMCIRGVYEITLATLSTERHTNRYITIDHQILLIGCFVAEIGHPAYAQITHASDAAMGFTPYTVTW